MLTFTNEDVKKQAAKNAAKSATPGWWRRFWCEHDFEIIETPCVALDTGETVCSKCIHCGHEQWLMSEDLPPKVRKPHKPTVKPSRPLYGSVMAPRLRTRDADYKFLTPEEYSEIRDKGVQKLKFDVKNPPPESDKSEIIYTNAAKQALRQAVKHTTDNIMSEVMKIAESLCLQRNGDKISFEDVQNAQNQMMRTHIMDDIAITSVNTSIEAYSDVAMEVRDEAVKTFRNKLTEGAEAACITSGRSTVVGKHVIMAINKLYRNYEVQDLESKERVLRTQCDIAKEDVSALSQLVADYNKVIVERDMEIMELLKELKFYSLRKNYKWVGEPLIPFNQPFVLEDNGKRARRVLRDNKKKWADDGHTEKG